MRRILILDSYRSSAEIVADYLQEQEESDIRIATTYAEAQDELKASNFNVVYMTSEMPMGRAVSRHCPEALVERVGFESVADREDKKEVLEAFLRTQADSFF
tara:strand:+ start:4293 stop:4598 length:306 start_codon:yes stop_codon:yes gene_type:complete